MRKIIVSLFATLLFISSPLCAGQKGLTKQLNQFHAKYGVLKKGTADASKTGRPNEYAKQLVKNLTFFKNS